MSAPLAAVLYAALTAASVVLWFDQALRRAFRGLVVTP